MVRGTRRDVLRVVGCVGAGSLGLMAGSGLASAAITVSGRVVAHDGDPVAGRVVQNYGKGPFYVYTSSEGKFSAESEPDAQLSLAFYKGDQSTKIAPVRNHVPHVYVFGNYYTAKEDMELGELTVPKAHLVRLRALDEDGNPVHNATPGVRHQGAGIGDHYMSTESDGWAYINGADFDGIELTGNTLLSMEIPVEGGTNILEKQVTIDGPKTVTFQVGDGVTVSETESSKGTATPSQPTTLDTTTIQDSTLSNPSQPKTTTSTPQSPTLRKTRTATGSTRRGSDNRNRTNDLKRGFFSNGESASDLGPLDDPFTLTIGGFALSVIGIAHQMIRGQ